MAEAMKEALHKTRAEFEHLRGVLLTVIPSFFFPSFLFKFTVLSSGMRSPEYTTLQVGETIAYPFHPLFNLKRQLCHMSDPFLPAL
jgi:hypothetical protein